MNIPFFTPKAIGSTLVGLGSMGGGGGAVYLYQMPKNWKDLLIKEGYVFLNKDEDYKGMFNDQKGSDNWKGESELNNASESDVKTKTENYCKTKFSTVLPSSSDANYSITKQKLISFCTTEGIQTVKARLIQSKQNSWIGDENGDDKGKTIFIVYRYNDEFIEWLKKDNEANSSLEKTSKADEHHDKLKTACTNLLKKNHKELTDKKYFNYGSWGCVDPGYTTIKEKIQKVDSDGEERPQDDSGGSTVKTKGEQTDSVKKWAKKAQNSSSEDLTEDGLKALCKSDYIGAKLADDNDNYQEKYLVIKSVCKKDNPTQ